MEVIGSRSTHKATPSTLAIPKNEQRKVESKHTQPKSIAGQCEKRIHDVAGDQDWGNLEDTRRY